MVESEPPKNPDPKSNTIEIEITLSELASDFLRAQAKIQLAEFDLLVVEGQELQRERELQLARYPSLKPVATALNREWFLKEGNEGTEKLAKLMEKFEEAGGSAQEKMPVEKMLEVGFAKIQEIKMKVVALRDEVMQYRELSQLLKVVADAKKKSDLSKKDLAKRG